jgi:hypothetical protein
MIAEYDFTQRGPSDSSLTVTFTAPPFFFGDATRNLGAIKAPYTDLQSFNSTLDFSVGFPFDGPEWRGYTFWGQHDGSVPLAFNFVRVGYSIATASGSLPTQARLDYSSDSGSTYHPLGTLDLGSPSGDLSFAFPTVTIAADNFFGAAFRLYALGGSGTDTRFDLTTGSFGGLQVGLQPVPEPASAILTGLALAGVAGVGLARRLNPRRPGSNSARQGSVHGIK